MGHNVKSLYVIIYSTTNHRVPIKINIEKKQMIYILLSGWCVILALWSCLFFGSAIISVRPVKEIQYWEQKTRPVDTELAVRFIGRIKESILITPWNATNQITLARIYEQLNQNQLLNKNTHLIFAVKHYFEAIKLRPTDPYPWIKLALIYENSEVDLHYQALIKSMRLGPYDRVNQRAIIPQILKYWEKIVLKKHDKELAINILKNSLKYHANSKITITNARINNKLAVLLPLTTHAWHNREIVKYLNHEK